MFGLIQKSKMARAAQKRKVHQEHAKKAREDEFEHARGVAEEDTSDDLSYPDRYLILNRLTAD